jgi:hypothetical protein
VAGYAASRYPQYTGGEPDYIALHIARHCPRFPAPESEHSTQRSHNTVHTIHALQQLRKGRRRTLFQFAVHSVLKCCVAAAPAKAEKAPKPAASESAPQPSKKKSKVKGEERKLSLKCCFGQDLFWTYPTTSRFTMSSSSLSVERFVLLQCFLGSAGSCSACPASTQVIAPSSSTQVVSSRAEESVASDRR